MTGPQRPDLTALDEIEDLLEAYARERLMPAGPVLRRIRRAVLAEAAAAEALRAAERRAVEAGRTAPRLRWSVPQLRMPRLALALGFSGAFLLGSGAMVLAAPPGSLLYDTRVALEDLFLPTQIDARLASHEDHLDARLAEAQAAASRGDAVGLAAALAAYQAEVEDALAELGANADLLAQLEEMLGRHVAVLRALEASVPEQAAVDKALESSQKAIVKIKEHPGSAPGGPPVEPGGAPQPPNRP